VQPVFQDAPFVNSVFHPSDFTAASENAFAHALVIALHRRTEFTILHAAGGRGSEQEWTRFPAVRSTLERWGLLESGSPRSAVFEELRLNVKKIVVRSDNPVTAALNYLAKNPTDLIVLATEGRDGLSRWVQRSLAERLARRSQAKTLFVPDQTRGFVDRKTGEVTLRRVLIPVDHRPSPEPAIIYSLRAAALLEDGGLEIILFHVGDEGSFPDVELPDSDHSSFTRICRQGDVVEQIVRAASEGAADLIMMTTEGRHGVLDALRGTVTEQVLRQAPCPLLAVPT
jgi:nucleotide-binding universal stress UspA family protein